MKPKAKPKQGGLTGKLLAVEPEYRFAVYKKILARRAAKSPRKGSPTVSGSFENGKRR